MKYIREEVINVLVHRININGDYPDNVAREIANCSLDDYDFLYRNEKSK